MGLYFLPFSVLLPLSPYRIIQIGFVFSTLDLWRRWGGTAERGGLEGCGVKRLWTLDWWECVSWEPFRALFLSWIRVCFHLLGVLKCLNQVELPCFPKEKSRGCKWDCLSFQCWWICAPSLLHHLFALPTSLSRNPYRCVIWFPQRHVPHIFSS